jgi:hypothetical protein
MDLDVFSAQGIEGCEVLRTFCWVCRAFSLRLGIGKILNGIHRPRGGDHIKEPGMEMERQALKIYDTSLRDGLRSGWRRWLGHLPHVFCEVSVTFSVNQTLMSVSVETPCLRAHSVNFFANPGSNAVRNTRR